MHGQRHTGHQWSWKWQYMIRFLHPLVAILESLITHFSPQEMVKEKKGLTPLTSTWVWEFRKALSVPNIIGASLVTAA